MSEKISGEKEKLIVDAARDRFAHYGYSKVTMEEIAADVEMGKASLYYYFPTKEDLFRSVMKQELNGFVMEMEMMLTKNISSCDKLRNYVSRRLELFQQFLNIGMLSLHSFVGFKSLFQDLFRELESEELSILKQIIKEGIVKKEIDKKTDEQVVKAFLHVLHGLRLRALKSVKGVTMSKKDFNQLKIEMIIMADIFIKGIRL